MNIILRKGKRYARANPGLAITITIPGINNDFGMDPSGIIPIMMFYN